MPGVLEGYEHDIFISYRQKDNRYDGWVTEFVDNLRKELEATFKDEVSIYFDINPHDGLLETYNVDASLKEKLKCLVFIPIISQTYCDPKSFAWQNEFIAFNKLAKNDSFGREIKLINGNVASRILPVKIHDLDLDDKSLIESELGGVLRSVDFIFKSSGVNRPLNPDDSRAENQNHTYYRDQINKVANAIKEIINGLKYTNRGDKQLLKTSSTSFPGVKNIKKLKFKIALLVFIIALLAVSGYLLLPVSSKTGDADKSIAVLPFENMSNDAGQEDISDGVMQEILSDLFMIGGLKVPSGTSSMRFKGSKMSVKEIARQLGVSYVLEGYVNKSADKVKIIVRLINGKNEKLIWSQDYNRDWTARNLLEIQSDVAQQVAENMSVAINPEVKQRIEAKPTLNTESYTLFLQALNQYLPFTQASPKLERAIYLDPGFANAYALLAYYWLHRGAVDGTIEREEVLKNAKPLLEKSLQLERNSTIAHTALASLNLYYYWDFPSVEKEYQIINKLNPSNSDLRATGFFSDYLLASGRYHEAFLLTRNAFNQNSRDNWTQMALTYYYNGQPENALGTIEKAEQLFPDDFYILTMSLRIYTYEEMFDKTIESFEKSILDKDFNTLLSLYLGHMGISYFKTGEKTKSDACLKELLARSRKTAVGSPSFFAAALYTAKGENEKAIQTLEKGYADHEVEMYWLNVEPLFRSLHGDPQFENILKKIGFK